VNDRFPYQLWAHRIHANAHSRQATVGAALELAGIAAAATDRANEANAMYEAVVATNKLLREDMAVATAAAAPRMVIDDDYVQLRDAFTDVVALLADRHYLVGDGTTECAAECGACDVLAIVPSQILAAHAARIDEPTAPLVGEPR
jgi:hypothetical protein